MIPIDEKLKPLQPVLGKQKVLKLRLMYLIEDNFKAKKEIENQIDLLIARYVKEDIEDEIILPPPEPQSGQDGIPIGNAVYRDKILHPVNLSLSSINRHIGIFGSTGSGKTTFAKHLIRQLHEKHIPVLIFDWEQSYRDLIHDIPDIQAFTVGHHIHPLHLNPLSVPPGISFQEYIKSLIAIISQDYIGGIGADTMLLNYMEMAFAENKSPAFEDLKQIVIREINNDMKKRGRLTGRSGLWKESVSRQMTFMSKGGAGTIINPSTHYSLENLFDRPVILEFGHLKSPYDRKFFIHLILNWLTIYNHHCGQTSDALKQVIVFEEFHNIAMKGKEENMVSSLFREARKYGIGLVAIDQTPSQIPNDIFANTNVKISFSLSTATDLAAMGKAMNLDYEKSKYLSMTKTGDAIIDIKQQAGEPFQIRAPFVRSPPNIADEELAAKMSQFSIQRDTNPAGFTESGSFQMPQLSDTYPPLLPLEKVILTHIIQRPLDGVDERTRTLGLHPSQMTDIQNALIQKEIVKLIPVDRKKLFELTPYGKEVAIDAGIQVPNKTGRGGLEHDYWSHQTCQFLRKQAFKPVLEQFDIDIVDMDAGIAIEIETGKSDIPKNLVKLENSHVLQCFMLTTTRELAVKLNQSAASQSKVNILYIRDFFKLTKNQIISNNLS